MHKLFLSKSLRTLLLGLGIALVAGCAATSAYESGNQMLAAGLSEEGLAKLEEATRLSPSNLQYRLTYLQQRTRVVNQLVAEGEAARRDGRLPEAEKAYVRVLRLEPGNIMAQQGAQAVIQERRHRQALVSAEKRVADGDAAGLAEAREAVRKVLSENPKQREAQALKAKIDNQLAQSQRSDSKLALAFRKPISLEFRDAPLKSVLDVVSRVSGMNFFIDKDVRPDLKVTILAKNTSIADAVRLLLTTNQLEQRVLNESSILIYPNTPQKLKDYQPLSVRTFYLANADVKAVSNTLKTILKSQDLVIDERLGLIIMRDTPEAIRMAEKLVALQDLSDPEVMLEVEILEIKRATIEQLGIDWPDQVTLTPIGGSGGVLTLDTLKNLSSDKVGVGINSLVISAGNEDQDGNILANPRIRVRNKEKAQVLIGDRVPVITTTSTSTGFVSESVSYIDVGLKLEVEPNIYLDEEVAIKVNLEVSSLVREVVSKSGTLSYQIGTRNANTVLRLRDGETQILAGLISDEERVTSNSVPGLGRWFMLDRIFGSQKNDRQRSEIVLSITPRLVRSIRRPDLIAAEFESGTSTAIGEPPLTLGDSEPQKEEAAAKAPVLPASSAVPMRPDNGAGLTTNPAPTPATSDKPLSLPPPLSGAPTTSPAAITATAPVKSASPANAQLEFSWRVPNEVRVGEQFTAALHLSARSPVKALPLQLSYDPQFFQVVSVKEGDFMKQGGGRTSFSEQVDPGQGRINVSVVREAMTGFDAGINGAGAIIQVNLKALKAGPSPRLQLLSASPDPQPLTASALPLDALVRLKP